MTRDQIKIRAELKRIAKSFRFQERESEKAANKERKRDSTVAAANYEGNAAAMKYCAQHVEHFVARMGNSKS